MKNIAIVIMIMCTVSVLTGCLYPQEKLQQNQAPYADQLAAVQTAVDSFQKESDGLLPIKTRDMSTPLYQKYPIDFAKLMPHFMQEPPGNSFENGGIYQYVLIDVETKPTVKLIDLRAAEKIRDIKLKLQMYRDQHQYPPFQKVLANGVFTLDYNKLGYDEEPYVVSPYSGENLPLVIDGQGEIYVDYSMDLYEALQKNGDKVQPGSDIRVLLTMEAPFVPAYSLPYTAEDKQPVFFVQ